MGQIRKLDKEGMRSRVDKKNLSGSSWTCFKMADQTLAEIDGIVSNCSVGGITIPRYESLADSIGKLEADSKLLLDYPDELIEGIDTVDSDFSHNVNNALNALSAIKLDDIRVKNTFDVEVTSVFNTHDHTGDPLNSPKPDLTIADFIGYFDEYAWGRDTSFVKGFTDVLYLEDIREGKSLQDILKEDNDTLKELLYGSEIDIKKYAPNAQYMSEIAGDIPGGIYPLATAIYGYDIFTHDRLTKKERKNEGITGTVELVLLLLLWGKADGLVEGVTPYLSMAGSNVAQTGAEHLCEDMGAPPLATLLISSTVGALAFVGGEAAGMKSAEIINRQRGVFKGVDKNASFSEAKKLAGECRTSYEESSEIITNKFPNEEIPADGYKLDYYISDGKIKGINGRKGNFDFIITKDGQLLIGSKHHYLGNAGDVVAAGQIKINGQGAIKRIDNLSGHYQPTLNQAINYQALFEQQGLSLNKTWLEYYYIPIDTNGYCADTVLEYIEMIEEVK